MALFEKKAAPATAPASKKAKHFIVKHEGTVSTFTAADGSGSLQVDSSKFNSETVARLIQSGLSRTMTSNGATLADMKERAAALNAGKWIQRKPSDRPKAIPAICEALANLAKAQGQGFNKADLYAKMCDPKSYQARFFDAAGKLIAARKAQLRELRSKDDVQAAIRQVKIARAKAKGKQEVSDLSALVA